MNIDNINDLVKLAGLVKSQEVATKAEVEEADCGCDAQPVPDDMYALLARLAQMGEVHEEEVSEEWANATDHFDGEDRVMDQPQGEPVDTSLRRYLGANGQPVKVEEAVQDHTVEDMMEAYNSFKTNAEITEMDDTDSGDWSFTTTDGHKVVDQIDPADGDKWDQYHVSTPVGDIYAYYDPSYDEDGGDFVEFDSENPEVKRMLPQSAKKDELNGIINKIVDTVAGGKADVEEDVDPGEETDYAKTFKTPYGEVVANWSFYSGGFDDFDVEDPILQTIINDMEDEYDEIDHDNVVDFIKAAMKKRKGMNEADVEEDNAFNTAAANAKKAGKSEFEFNGKKYKVKMDAKTADALTDDIDILRKLSGLV